MEHVSGDLQKADILTTVLGRIKFKEMKDLIAMQEVVRNDFKLKGKNVGISVNQKIV